MPTATLRAVGGSVVMAIPKRILELVVLQMWISNRLKI
jgi:hypothetical protein